MQKNRIRIGLTLVFACLIVFCSAQSSIQIKSYEDQKPLAFASVVNLTKRQLHHTNENGIVAANFDINDSILISYVGYQNRKIRIETTGSVTYFLKQSNTVLEPVRIVNCKHWIKHEYSNLISDTAKRKFGGVGWSKNAMNAKIAVMLKPGFEDIRLNSFSIWLKKGMGTPIDAIQAPLLFSFYSLDESTMLPGELISSQQVAYHPKKEGKQTIQIDTLNINISKKGMYVAIEYVYNEKYEYPMRHLDPEKGIDSIYMKYGGLIDGVYSRDFTLVLYNYESNSWLFPMQRDKSAILEVHGTIKCSAELSYCKDFME